MNLNLDELVLSETTGTPPCAICNDPVDHPGFLLAVRDQGGICRDCAESGGIGEDVLDMLEFLSHADLCLHVMPATDRDVASRMWATLALRIGGEG